MMLESGEKERDVILGDIKGAGKGKGRIVGSMNVVQQIPISIWC